MEQVEWAHLKLVVRLNQCLLLLFLAFVAVHARGLRPRRTTTAGTDGAAAGTALPLDRRSWVASWDPLVHCRGGRSRGRLMIHNPPLHRLSTAARLADLRVHDSRDRIHPLSYATVRGEILGGPLVPSVTNKRVVFPVPPEAAFRRLKAWLLVARLKAFAS